MKNNQQHRVYLLIIILALPIDYILIVNGFYKR
jgi:hypothetical protein